MSKPDVLIINSYAGSLVVAAKAAGLKIRGSYEDSGYGIDLQQANFPDLDYRETRDQWPERQDLRDTIVLAHPPCAAFSAQNNSPSKRGKDAPKFQCTLDVINYAMTNRALALCVESVPGALEGAREVHDAFAKEHGYQLFRVMQNAVTFGVPQWRPRFWAIFVRKGALKQGRFTYHHEPERTTVKDILDARGPAVEVLERKLAEQVRRLKDDFGPKLAHNLVRGEYGYGMLPALLRRKLRSDGKKVGSQLEVARKHCVWGFYMSQTMRVLDPRSHAFTILGISWWTVNGRNLTQREWKRLMGFPADYAVPERRVPQLRFYLSRGVCPPVARWIAETTIANVTGRTSRHSLEARPGDLIDVQPRSRKRWADGEDAIGAAADEAEAAA